MTYDDKVAAMLFCFVMLGIIAVTLGVYCIVLLLRINRLSVALGHAPWHIPRRRR